MAYLLYPQQPEKSTMWSGAGLNIDVDNLLTSTPKNAQTSTAPSMNQLAKGTTPSPSHPPPTSSSSAYTAGGPNYSINTASLMGSGSTMAGGVGIGGGMGMGGGIGMGGGMGMGQVGMGYGGGYGAPPPGMMPMYGSGYGMAPRPGMGMGPVGYGGLPPSVGGSQPMGAQQKFM